MKSEKGITLMALVIYIVIFVIILAIMGTVTANFTKNISEVKEPVEAVVEFNKFSMLFISDVKQNKTCIETEDNKILQFEDETIYTYNQDEKAVYRKVKDGEDVKIAKHIRNINYEILTEEVDGFTKNILKVNITIGAKEGETIERNIEFVLKYW